jgi:hypothetical protein
VGSAVGTSRLPPLTSRRLAALGEIVVHITLSPKANRIGIACFAGIALLLLVLTSGALWSFCALGAALGIVSGILQHRELRSRPAAFAQAKTSRDVRRILSRSWPGKLAIATSWICSGSLVVMASIQIETPRGSVLAWFSGALAFAAERDLIAYPALSRVAAEADALAITSR